jgi:signal transduction histidine kinase
MTPSFTDLDQAQRTRNLSAVQIGVIAVLMVGLVTSYLFQLGNSIPAVVFGLAAALVSIWLNRRGHTQAGALLLMLMLVTMETLLMVAGQGVHDITVIVLPVILVMSSLLLEGAAFVVVILYAISSSVSVGFLEIFGVLVTETSQFTDKSDLFLLPAILILTAGVVRLLSDTLISSLREARQRLAHLATLNQVGQAVASGLDLEQTLITLYERIQTVAPNDAFSVALYNHASSELTFPLFIDLGKQMYVPPSEIRDKPGLTGEVIARRSMLYLADLYDPAYLEGLELVHVGESRIRTYLGLPLILQDEVIGVMSVQSQKPHAYGPDQISLLETIAAQAAIALDNARLYAALRTELVERRRIEKDLHRRDSILEAVSLAAGKFLTGDDWRGSIRAVLARLGQENGARRACIGMVTSPDEASYSDGSPVITILYDWTAPAAPAFDQDHMYPRAAAQVDGFARWLAATRAGDAYTARLFPAPTLTPSHPLGASALSYELPMPNSSSHLTAPIRVAGDLWGFIAFESAGGKTWSTVEIGAIQVATGLLGAAIGRQRDDEYIHRLNADLEARVRERTADLESFAYSVAHDLRTPLRGIDGYSKLLLDDFGDRLEGDGVVYLHNVRRAAQWMGQIIEDMLKLSRVTRVEMRCARVDLSAVAVDVAARLAAQDPQRTIRWLIQPGLEIDGDPNLLRLALDNLLHNAWKFTDRRPDACVEFGVFLWKPGDEDMDPLAASSPVWETPHSEGEPAPAIRMQPDRMRPEHIPADATLPLIPTRIFFVRDNGAGFDMRYADKLFTPFQRLHTSNEYEGSGVGLATVQRIIRRHNGEIWGRSARDQGACFYFSLPE